MAFNVATDFNTFNYIGCDYLSLYARKFGMLTRGNRLLSGNDQYADFPPPAFLQNVTDAEVLGDFITNYVKTTVGHYKGKVYAWDVVDEAVVDIPDGDDPTKMIRQDSVY